jgi:hypothetical protein
MTENPAAYKIPDAVQLNFMHSKTFSSAVGAVLSNTRGEMKRKVFLYTLILKSFLTLS